MATLHNQKPEKVIKAFERAGWINKETKRKPCETYQTWKPEYTFNPSPQRKASKNWSSERSDKKIRFNGGRVFKITLRTGKGQIWRTLPKTK